MATRRAMMTAAAAAALLSPASRALAKAGDYWPGAATWETIDPRAAGFDADRLAAAVKAGLDDQSTSVIVLRGGRIVAEAYGAGGGVDKAREIASAGKSMVSVLTGMAIDDGKIKSVDQTASDFIPQWKGTPKQAVTIRHLLSMTSGLDDAAMALRNVQGDQFTLNSTAPIAFPPGEHWAYATAMYHLMFHIVERAVGEPFEAYAKRKLVGPLGMSGTTWLTNKGHAADGREVTNYYTAICTARDLARFGLFALRGGEWNGRQLIKADYLKAATRPSQTLNGAYGWLWWENAERGFPASGRGTASYQFGDAPADAFAALGAGEQDVMVVPSADLVVIRQGAAPSGAAAHAMMLPSVLAAMQSPRLRRPS